MRSLCVWLLVFATVPAFSSASETKIPFQLRQDLSAAVSRWVGEVAESPEKRVYFSRDFRPLDDGSYQTTAHLETAEFETKVTERFLLTLARSEGAFEVQDQALQDTYRGMHRESGFSCHPFAQMNFEREGLSLSAGNGSLCASYYQGKVSGFLVQADDAHYRFEPPESAIGMHLLPDFHALFQIVKGSHERELSFTPAAFAFNCDPDSCEEIISEHFSGLGELNREAKGFASGSIENWAAPLLRQTAREREENPFAHFRYPYRPGNKAWSVFVMREVDPFTYPGQEPGLFDFSGSLPGPGVQLAYNNWGGYEITFNVWPRSLIDPEALFGTIFGYYSEETLKTSDPYTIERRDDQSSRWHQVYSVKGEVDMGTDDPEMLEARIEFGIELKQPLRELPFFIQSIPLRSFDGSNKARALHVNSVQLDGEELTWTRTSQLGGIVVLPREMPAGSKLKLTMDFKTRALIKWTQAFTQVSRFGWMPFVRFADFIDEFELTIRSPAKYTVLGIGHQVSSHTEGETIVTHWKADSPVVFPSIALGKYEFDTAGKKFDPARKTDGTVIPVVVHVDEDSFSQWGIAPKNLRPIAQQAVNSINLYSKISGLDYPYGELNLVNDPKGFLYGQAPSSLIYLGSGVFRGEGFLAAMFANNPRVNSTSIAKFLKSVVAHEVGHQWWGSRISNANSRNYWFVESLAEYFSALYLEAAYGRKEYDEQVEEWRQTILGSNLKSSVQNASTVWSGEGGGYTAAVYNKGPFAFHMLREIFGDEKFFVFLRQFSQELAAKREIVTLDIQRAAEDALGGVSADGEPYRADLGWFFDQWIRSSGIPQFRFEYSTRQAEDGGWLLEGTIEQRVVIGSGRSFSVVEGTYYRGVVDIKVHTRDGDFAQRMVVEGEKTPFRFKFAGKPLIVTLNENNQTLAHDVRADW